MSEPTSAREAILARIRAALPGEPANVAGSHGSIVRAYRRTGELSAEESLHLFLDRLIDYDTEIVQVEGEGDIAAAIAGVLQHSGERRVLIAPAFPAAWLPGEFAFTADHALPVAALEEAQAVLTTCEAAVSSTGTIILVHTGAQGRRAMTLLPDHHICIVRRDLVFETLPQALEAVAPHMRKAITTISGPSATSDIEMTRIRGVHGPRRLTVILYGDVAAK